jgi:hypothetical protein
MRAPFIGDRHMKNIKKSVASAMMLIGVGLLVFAFSDYTPARSPSE